MAHVAAHGGATHDAGIAAGVDLVVDLESRLEHVSLPRTPEAREALLQDAAGLSKACETYVAALGFGADRNIGVRTTGRVVAYIHRQFNLAVPSDDVLYSAIMEHAWLGGSFALTHQEFVQFAQDVLRQCLQGKPLAKKRPATVPLPTKRAATSEGMITVVIQRLNGDTMEMLVDDSHTVQQAFAAQVELEFGIATSCQQLLHGTDALEAARPLYEQAVTSGTVLTAVHMTPQATLLRIRRCHLGRTIPSSRHGRPLSVGNGLQKAVRAHNEHDVEESAKTCHGKDCVSAMAEFPQAKPAVVPLAPRDSHFRASAAHKGGRRVFR